MQTIDNMWRSYKLGTLFEFKVGKGSVLVSAINLAAIEETPEGNTLYQSLVDYVGSESFNSETQISVAKFLEVLAYK